MSKMFYIPAGAEHVKIQATAEQACADIHPTANFPHHVQLWLAPVQLLRLAVEMIAQEPRDTPHGDKAQRVTDLVDLLLPFYDDIARLEICGAMLTHVERVERKIPE